ncbi:dihydrodipicolinate synthase [Corynebacterium phocae]|uniref:4-hydroxy-tetrahydrodipicolinate synthase n=1 Tax=Corynebacterium phocae TaxID=161895 RepID=A0A1L7D344_9CORY|nr:4-hydroxy-tetrahydrodipicolinate synthase [Corynebacterium phocae]APT92352.1 dihydrodipicolinate synthase [Corynebacterium phocae]KAA8724944.1 4-hydroxy-tetrahydrodipicolinate synthase [Corynebacterium phocae]
MSTGMTAHSDTPVFGRVGVAMVTPFDHHGALDTATARRVATHLVDNGVDSLFISGTTGEAPTTTPEEKIELLKAVIDEVGTRAKVCAGVGTNNTKVSVELAKAAAKAGADSLLVVTPYYSKPSQDGVFAHFEEIAKATDLPVCVYDIPGRSGIAIEADTLRRLAKLPTISAVKDAKGHLGLGAELMHETGIDWYSGDDPLNIPWLSLGASGLISVIGHAAPQYLAELYTSFEDGDLARAREINATHLIPLMHAQARLGGVTMAKSALRLQGLDCGSPRLPVLDATESEIAELRQDMTKAGVFKE